MRILDRSSGRRLLALEGAFAAALLLGMGVAGCKRNAPPASATATPAAQNLGAQVTVASVRIGAITNNAEVTGALSALQDVMVGVKTSGKMASVFFREGDVVKAGQVVAQQDTTDLRSQLEQQRANLLTQQTKLAQSKVVLESAQQTLKLTDEQTLSAVRLAQAGLDSAKEQAKIVQQGARPQERQQAQENVAAAKADRDQARADLKRYQDLYRQQAVSAQQLDQAQSVADAAQARYNSAVQALSLIQEGSRREDIQRAQAAVEQANQQLITAQSNRTQVNLRRADVETARVGILSAQASVRQAEASVRIAEQALRDSTIVSPISGVVAERKVEPGMQIGTAKPDVMRIVSLDDIYFDAQLSETQYAEVRPNQSVTITVDALPGRTFQGAVSKIFPIASATARSFTVRIGIRNEANLLRPQMFARGQILLATHARAMLAPREAILDYNGTTGRVFVALDSKAEERPVKTGFANMKEVEITSGVKEGEQVITVGQGQLQNGDKIQVQTATPATKEARSNVP